MPWCHNCHVEYVEGIETCADCGAPLLSDPPPDTKTVTGEWVKRDMAHLCSTASSVEADNIVACLRAEEIPVSRRLRGAGLHMNIVMGYTEQGADLFVPVERLEEARELLAAFEISLDGDGFVETPEPDELDEAFALARRKRARLLFVWTGVAILLLCFILMAFAR